MYVLRRQLQFAGDSPEQAVPAVRLPSTMCPGDYPLACTSLLTCGELDGLSLIELAFVGQLVRRRLEKVMFSPLPTISASGPARLGGLQLEVGWCVGARIDCGWKLSRCFVSRGQLNGDFAHIRCTLGRTSPASQTSTSMIQTFILKTGMHWLGCWFQITQHTNQKATLNEAQGCPSWIPALDDITVDASNAPKENLSAGLIVTPQSRSAHLRPSSATRLEQRVRLSTAVRTSIYKSGCHVQVSLPSQ